MSENTRRQQIEAMLKDEPEDTFLRYALATELEKDEQHEDSLEILHKLTLDSPPYVPAFFMAGQQLSRLDRIEEARDWLTRGIEQAQQQGNLHAAGEMQEFLMAISD